jgi:Homeodomain-like domain
VRRGCSGIRQQAIPKTGPTPASGCFDSGSLDEQFFHEKSKFASTLRCEDILEMKIGIESVVHFHGNAARVSIMNLPVCLACQPVHSPDSYLFYTSFDYSRNMPRVAPAVSLDPTMKAALDKLVRSPSAPQGLVQRGRIVLAAAAGKTNEQIAGELQIPEVTVGKWRRSFASQGWKAFKMHPVPAVR